MKSFLWIILSLFIAHCAAQNTDQTSLMSYNIRLDHAGDKENNWHYRKADMSSFLNTMKPDFIGIQEAQHHQLQYLDSSLQAYSYLGVGRDDGLEGGEYSPIFYNKDRWSPIESNTFWLSSTPLRVSRGWDAVCMRVCTYGLFKDKKDQNILVLNTHFDHVGNEARINSLNLIKKFVDSFEDVTVVLMGDFNFEPSSPLYHALPAEFSDVFTLMSSPETAPTFNGFKEDNIATRRIDYILLNEPAKFIKYKVEHPKTQSGRQLSDHYPIQLTIDL